MTTKSPRQLTAPILENYPFITMMFLNDVQGFVAHDGESPMGDPTLRGRLAETNFDWPSAIKPETIAILGNMSDATFQGLCSVLGPKYGDFAVKTKADLHDLANQRQQYVKPDPDEGLNHYTHEQLQSYLMFGSECSKNIHWGNFVSFYNDAPDGQQALINQYFDVFHGQDLDVLLAHAVMPIEIPEAFRETFETKEHAGNAYHYSEDKGKWLREDRFHQQYRLDVTLAGSSFSLIRASAPTLKLAIVKATALAMAGGDNTIGRLEIFQAGVPVMHADIVHSEKLVDGAPAPVPTSKLRWDFNNIGPDKSHLKKNKQYSAMAINDYKEESAKQEMHGHIAKLDELIAQKPPFPSHVLLKIVLGVEKKLKLQWSKVYRLEDDLGM